MAAVLIHIAECQADPNCKITIAQMNNDMCCPLELLPTTNETITLDLSAAIQLGKDDRGDTIYLGMWISSLDDHKICYIVDLSVQAQFVTKTELYFKQQICTSFHQGIVSQPSITLTVLMPYRHRKQLTL